jgi:hypothetical protein
MGRVHRFLREIPGWPREGRQRDSSGKAEQGPPPAAAEEDAPYRVKPARVKPARTTCTRRDKEMRKWPV